MTGLPALGKEPKMTQITIFDTTSNPTGPDIVEYPGVKGGPAIRITDENICKAKKILSCGVEMDPTNTDCAEAYGISMLMWILGLSGHLIYTGAALPKDKRNLRLEMPYKMSLKGIEFEVVR